MNSAERKVMYTAWGYFRDHAKTPEQKAIMAAINQILKQDAQRRNKSKERKAGREENQ